MNQEEEIYIPEEFQYSSELVDAYLRFKKKEKEEENG